MALRGSKRFHWAAIPSVGALFRARRPRVLCSSPRGSRRLAADRGTHEFQILPSDRPSVRHSSSGHVSVPWLSAHEPPLEEGVLLLALPGRNPIGEPLEGRARYLWPHSAPAEMG